MVNEDSSENTKDKNTAVRTTIRDLLNAPETYKSQTTDDSAKLVVNTDATVEIPDVEKISAISVTPAEVTQDLLDRITDAFFSEAKLYTSDSYYTQTKDEIKKTLDELKEDVANGILGRAVSISPGDEDPGRRKTCCRLPGDRKWYCGK